MKKLLPWLRLVRLPNLPSAVTNVFAGAGFGIFLGGTFRWDNVLLASLAGLCIYTAGLVFNDVADLELDRKLRPERPIPSGEISKTTAASFGTLLILVAVGIALNLGPTSCKLLIGIAVLAVLYDFFLKSSPVFGPMALASCRAGNWLVGFISVASTELSFESIVHGPLGIAAGYFFYILALASLARMEDSEIDPKRMRIELVFVLLAIMVLRWQLPGWNGALLTFILLYFFIRCWQETRALNQAAIRQTVGTLLFGIYWIDAAVAYSGFGLWSLLILLPFFFASAIRKQISPT